MTINGNKIKAIMDRRGVSVQTLAHRMAVQRGTEGSPTPQAIYKWISGETSPTSDHYALLLDVLECERKDLED